MKQVLDLTDKIGLRLRLLKAIEKERANQREQSSNTSTSAKASSLANNSSSLTNNSSSGAQEMQDTDSRTDTTRVVAAESHVVASEKRSNHDADGDAAHTRDLSHDDDPARDSSNESNKPVRGGGGSDPNGLFDRVIQPKSHHTQDQSASTHITTSSHFKMDTAKANSQHTPGHPSPNHMMSTSSHFTMDTAKANSQQLARDWLSRNLPSSAPERVPSTSTSDRETASPHVDGTAIPRRTASDDSQASPCTESTPTSSTPNTIASNSQTNSYRSSTVVDAARGGALFSADPAIGSPNTVTSSSQSNSNNANRPSSEEHNSNSNSNSNSAPRETKSNHAEGPHQHHHHPAAMGTPSMANRVPPHSMFHNNTAHLHSPFGGNSSPFPGSRPSPYPINNLMQPHSHAYPSPRVHQNIHSGSISMPATPSHLGNTMPPSHLGNTMPLPHSYLSPRVQQQHINGNSSVQQHVNGNSTSRLLRPNNTHNNMPGGNNNMPGGNNNMTGGNQNIWREANPGEDVHIQVHSHGYDMHTANCNNHVVDLSGASMYPPHGSFPGDHNSYGNNNYMPPGYGHNYDHGMYNDHGYNYYCNCSFCAPHHLHREYGNGNGNHFTLHNNHHGPGAYGHSDEYNIAQPNFNHRGGYNYNDHGGNNEPPPHPSQGSSNNPNHNSNQSLSMTPRRMARGQHTHAYGSNVAHMPMGYHPNTNPYHPHSMPQLHNDANMHHVQGPASFHHHNAPAIQAQTQTQTQTPAPPDISSTHHDLTPISHNLFPSEEDAQGVNNHKHLPPPHTNQGTPPSDVKYHGAPPYSNQGTPMNNNYNNSPGYLRNSNIVPPLNINQCVPNHAPGDGYTPRAHENGQNAPGNGYTPRAHVERTSTEYAVMTPRSES